MDRMQIVCGCLIDRDHVFIAQRIGKDAGIWEFPGGKVEIGESYEQAVRRELKEELDIKARIIEKLCVIEDDTKDIPLSVTAYACKILEGKICLKVHSKGLWILPKAIDLSTFHTSDEPIITALAAFMSEYQHI